MTKIKMPVWCRLFKHNLKVTKSFAWPDGVIHVRVECQRPGCGYVGEGAMTEANR